MEMNDASSRPTPKRRRLNRTPPSEAMRRRADRKTPPAPGPLLHKAPVNTQTTDPPIHHIETRGRPNEEYWPKADPMLNEHPKNTQTVEEQSYALDAKEMLHDVKCKHHFDGIPLSSWERTSWSQRGLRKHPCHLEARCAAMLICRRRCGRPVFRTDTRDQRWFCSDHDPFQPRRQSKLLGLLGEI
jgi:hypothetical protein